MGKPLGFAFKITETHNDIYEVDSTSEKIKFLLKFQIACIKNPSNRHKEDKHRSECGVRDSFSMKK